MGEADVLAAGGLATHAEDFRAAARAFCAKLWPEREVRRLMSTPAGRDRGAWQRLGEMGVLGTAVPAAYGGTGAGLPELAPVAQELGRVLALGPFVGSVALTTTAVLRSEDEQIALELLPGLVRGTSVASMVASDRHGRWAPSRMDVHAAEDGAGWALTGTAAHVLDADDADVLLVLAETEAGPSLFLVDVHRPVGRVDLRPLSTLDQTRPQSTVHLSGAHGRLVGRPGAGRSLVEQASDVAAVVLAADAAGGARRVLKDTLFHARNRIQFGRPVGSFQAVKHLCADMFVAVEAAQSTAEHAAAAVQAGPDSAGLEASLAFATCTKSYLDVTAAAIQVHGGVGFSWDHPLHLFFKRAVGNAALLGGRSVHVERLAALVLDGPST